MAKKETTKDAPGTVASKAASKIASNVLRQNPDINEVHVTSDGTAFYTRNDAQNHANSLANREVFSTKRDVVTTKASSNKSKADAAAEGEPEIGELTGEAVNDEISKTDD